MFLHFSVNQYIILFLTFIFVFLEFLITDVSLFLITVVGFQFVYSACGFCSRIMGLIITMNIHLVGLFSLKSSSYLTRCFNIE